MSLSEIIVPAL